MVWHQSVWNPVLTSYPPSSQKSSTDDQSCAKSPHALNAPPSSLSQRNPKWLDLMTRPVSLTSVALKSFERLVLAYLKDTNGPLLDHLQFAYRATGLWICTYQTCTHIIVYIIYCVFAILYIACLYIVYNYFIICVQSCCCHSVALVVCVCVCVKNNTFDSIQLFDT